MLVSVCLQGYLTSLSMKAFSYISLDGVVTGESRGAVHPRRFTSSILWDHPHSCGNAQQTHILRFMMKVNSVSVYLNLSPYISLSLSRSLSLALALSLSRPSGGGSFKASASPLMYKLLQSTLKEVRGGRGVLKSSTVYYVQ